MMIKPTKWVSASRYLGWTSLLLCALSGQAFALTTWTVTSNGAGNGSCDMNLKTCTTLQSALGAAANDIDAAQKIVFDPSIEGQTNKIADTFYIGFSKNLIIEGAAGGTVLDGNNLGTVFTIVNSSAVIGLNRLTIQHGNNSFHGGIHVDSATLTLTDATVSDNNGPGIFATSGSTLTIDNSTIANNTGIGIDTHGSSAISNSTVSDNSDHGIFSTGISTISNTTISGNQGVGIYNFGTLTIDDSTIAGNTSAVQGGGISNSGNLTLNNSTLAGNSSPTSGGGIASSVGTTITLNNATIAGNTATNSGGGIFLNGGSVYLRSSLIAGNGGNCCTPDIAHNNGTLISQGHNLIGNGSTAEVFLVNGQNNDQVGSNVAVIDAKFVLDGQSKPLLANNGGPTQTIALQSGSPAFGAGDCSLNTTDQRGYLRPATLCDIGALQETLFRGNFDF